MKKYLNTLYVTTQGAYLNKEGETVVVSVEKETKLQLPIHTISGIVCFGNVAMSPFLMGHCAEHQVGVSFISEYGRFLARVQGKTSGNVFLRRVQYRLADSCDNSLAIARNMVVGKIANGRAVLNRALRDHEDKMNNSALDTTWQKLRYAIERAEKCADIDILRGIEGESAHAYFDVFNDLITAQKDDFVFNERNRRPPLDPVNCLLSFVYMLLAHDVQSALESVGLDSYVGFLHRDRPGRASLALDMMEEFRPFIADRLVLSLINRQQVSANGFKRETSGAYLMADDTRKEVLTAYQKRKQEEITHPYLNETMPLGLVFYIQAQLLARFIRGDIDGYPVFLWK